MAGHRMGRVNEELRRELSDIIRNLKDPRIPLLTSVTAVEATSDLKEAKIWVSIMADEEAVAEALRGLESAAGFMRREIAKRLRVRNIPSLTFVRDDAIAYGAKMSKIISDMNIGEDDDGELE